MSVLLAVTGDLETDILLHLAEAKPPITVARRCADRAEMLGAAQAGLGSVAVVEDADMAFIHELHSCGVQVLGVGASGQARSRGFDAVCSPYGAEVRACVLQLLERPVPELVEVAVPAREPGRIVGVWGTDGSPGRSCLARDLAAAFAHGGEWRSRRSRFVRRAWRRRQAEEGENRAKVLLIDADTRNPSLAQLLSLDQESSAIAAVARKIGLGEGSPELLESAAVPVAGFDFLAGLNRGSRWRELSEPVVREIFAQARAGWNVTVVDCAAGAERNSDGYGPERDAATLELLEAADDVVLLGRATPVGIRRLLDRIDEAGDMGVCRLHVALVRSRATGRASEGEADVVRMLADKGIEEFVWLGDDRTRYEEAERRGLTLAEIAPTSGGVRAVDELAERIADAGPVIDANVSETRGGPVRAVFAPSLTA